MLISLTFCNFAAEMPKRIIYSVPVDVMSGSLSGPQELQYGTQGGEAYDIPSGSREGATNYEPRLVAMYSHKKRLRYFQVRTKHAVNMTDAMRINLATMGGAGAIYSAIVSDKTSQLYNDCVHACPDGKTLRGWLVPILRPALAAKETDIVLADGLVLSNPWNAGTGATINIPQTILDKFASELCPVTSPYSAAATQALMNAFPAQWQTICDYGFAHRAIVPYMDAYAPEDPKIAYSLVEGIGVRLCVGDNTNYADTGVYGTNNTHAIFKGMITKAPTVWAVPFGADVTYNVRNFSAWLSYQSNKDCFCYGNQLKTGLGPIPINTIFTLDANKENWSVVSADGTLLYDYTFNVPANYITPHTLPVFTSYRENSPSIMQGISEIACASMEIIDGNTHVLFIPFQRNGQMELLDILSGNLAARTGTFSELIVPAN